MQTLALGTLNEQRFVPHGLKPSLFLRLRRRGWKPHPFKAIDEHLPQVNPYSVASFSITTLKCVVTSLCSLRGTVNSPRVLRDSCS